MSSKGQINGPTFRSGVIEPSGHVSRASCAAMLMRCCSFLKSTDVSVVIMLNVGTMRWQFGQRRCARSSRSGVSVNI